MRWTVTQMLVQKVYSGKTANKNVGQGFGMYSVTRQLYIVNPGKL